MQARDWPQKTVAIVPVRFGGAELTVALAIGVGTQDINHLGAGTVRVEDTWVIYDGPPCPFTLGYAVSETGESRQMGRGDGVFDPRHRVMFQVAPPAPQE